MHYHTRTHSPVVYRDAIEPSSSRVMVHNTQLSLRSDVTGGGVADFQNVFTFKTWAMKFCIWYVRECWSVQISELGNVRYLIYNNKMVTLYTLWASIAAASFLSLLSPNLTKLRHLISSAYLPTFLPVHLPIYWPTYLHTYLPTYLPIFISICLDIGNLSLFIQTQCHLPEK